MGDELISNNIINLANMRLWSIKKTFKFFETREIVFKHMTC